MNNKKILIAEDEESLNKALTESFKKEEYQVQSVKDGQSCINMAQSFAPDLILLDLLMPNIDGIEVLRQLQRNDETKDIPVIVLTNLSEMEKISEVMEIGVYDYLIKTDETLEQIIEKVRDKLKG